MHADKTTYDTSKHIVFLTRNMCQQREQQRRREEQEQHKKPEPKTKVGVVCDAAAQELPAVRTRECEAAGMCGAGHCVGTLAVDMLRTGHCVGTLDVDMLRTECVCGE